MAEAAKSLGLSGQARPAALSKIRVFASDSVGAFFFNLVPQVTCANPGLPRLERFGVSDPIPASKLGDRNAGFSSIVLSGWNNRKRDILGQKDEAVLLKYGVAYQVSRFQTGQNVGEWMVVVEYADWMAYAKAQDGLAHVAEHRQVVAEISKIVTLIRRELVVNLDL